jgi:hypothetical protein
LFSTIACPPDDCNTLTLTTLNARLNFPMPTFLLTFFFIRIRRIKQLSPLKDNRSIKKEKPGVPEEGEVMMSHRGKMGRIARQKGDGPFFIVRWSLGEHAITDFYNQKN